MRAAGALQQRRVHRSSVRQAVASVRKLGGRACQGTCVFVRVCIVCVRVCTYVCARVWRSCKGVGWGVSSSEKRGIRRAAGRHAPLPRLAPLHSAPMPMRGVHGSS